MFRSVFYFILMSCGISHAAEFCGSDEIAIRIFSSYTCAKNIKLIEYTEFDGAMRFTTVANDENEFDKPTYVAGSYKISGDNEVYVNRLVKEKLANKTESVCGLDVYNVKAHAASNSDVIWKMYVSGDRRLELVTFNEVNNKQFLNKYCEMYSQSHN